MRAMNVSTGLFRLLLRLYPAAFRERFGEDMVQVFRDCWRDAHSSGGLSLAALWLGTLADVAQTAVKERLLAMGQTQFNRMDTTFDTQLVSTFELFSRMLRGGFNIMQTMDVIASSAPEPTASALRVFLADVHGGKDFVEALTELQTRVGSKHLEALIDVIATQRREGGNLADRVDQALNDIRRITGRDGWSDCVVTETLACDGDSAPDSSTTG